MIEELNRMIKSGALKLAPFKTAGDGKALSTNASPAGAVFALAEESPERLRLYTNAAPLSDFVRESAEALLSVLTLAGPSSAYPELKIGADDARRYLWISCTLSADECREDRLPESLSRFIASSAALRAMTIEAINAAVQAGAAKPAAEPAPASASPEAPASAPEALPEDMSSDEMMDYIASRQTFWG